MKQNLFEGLHPREQLGREQHGKVVCFSIHRGLLPHLLHLLPRRHVQCVLNFADNLCEDGGTLVVPRFHRQLSSWTSQHTDLRKPLPWSHLSAPVEEQLLRLSHRVAMREGSVLIWDQTLAHGSSPNASHRCRFAQFLKAYSRSASFGVSTAADGEGEQRRRRGGGVGGSDEREERGRSRLVRRARALRAQLEKSGALPSVDGLGRYLFGLDVLDEEEVREFSSIDHIEQDMKCCGR